MTAAWLWARSRMRRRWRTLTVIALVAGLGGGVAVTAATGSRRAATGWKRFGAATKAPDALLALPPDKDDARFAKLESLPGVAAAARFTYVAVAPAPLVPGHDAGSFVGFDPDWGVSVYRPRIIEGRRPRPGVASEITVNRPLAKLGHLRTGQRVRLRSGFDPKHLTDLGEVTVVGVHTGTFDVGANAGSPSALLSAAFLAAHRSELESALGGQPVAVARLVDGPGGVPAVARAVQALYGPETGVLAADQEESVVVDAVNVQAVGLGLLAIAAGLASLVASLQAIGRLLRSDQDDLRVLRSLGLRRREVVASGGVMGAVVGAVAAVIAIVIGVSASRLVPTGTAGRLEAPGIRPEPLVLALGAALLLVALAASGGLLGLRALRPSESPRTKPARGAGPLPVQLGLHWTFSRVGASAATAAARAALVAVTVGLAGVAAVVTFANSVDHLVGTERLYGWSFDGAIGSGDLTPAQLEQQAAGLLKDERVEALAWGSIADIPAGSHGSLEVLATKAVRGVAGPTVIAGRAPVAADEIAAGSESLAQAGLHVGDSVMLGSPPKRFSVVGKAVYPELGNNGDLANFGSVTSDGLRRLGGESLQSLALVKVRPGVSVKDVLTPYAKDAEVVTPGPPPRVRNIKEIGALPWFMAGFLALLALIAIGHALALSVRARRRDLSVLRALGAVRRQVAVAVWSQATVTVLVGAVLGVPVGIALGRQAWSVVANGLGVVNEPNVGWLALSGLVVVVVVVANVVATGPAIVAARLRPGAVLRAE